MTPREQALMAYFYTVATDPKMVAAGYSLTKVKDALLSCIAEDVPAVLTYVLRGAVGKAEVPVRTATTGVAATMLGGTVSPEVAKHALGALDALVADGFRRMGEVLEKRKKRS